MDGGSRYLLWAKVLREYRGGPKSLDVHALEAAPGILRVAEANFGWNLFIQFLLIFLIFAPALATYEVVLAYIPSLGTGSGGLTFQGVLLFVVALVVAAAIIGVDLSGSHKLGRFILRGAFIHARKVHSLSILQVESMRSPRTWRLRCRTGQQELAVVVIDRGDRLRAALETAGQPFDSVTR